MASPVGAPRMSVITMPPPGATVDPLGSSRMNLTATTRTVVAGQPTYVMGGSFVAAPQYVAASSTKGGSFVANPTMTAATLGGSFVAAPSAVKATMAAPQEAEIAAAKGYGIQRMTHAVMTRTVTAPHPYVTTNSASAASVVTMSTPAAAPQPLGTASAPLTYTARSLSTAVPMTMGQTVVSAPKLAGPSAEYVAKLEQRLSDLEVYHACRTHSAVVFIKPHAVTDSVKKLAADHLKSFGIHILSEGEIAAEEIDQQQLIDTHYGAIAAKAVKLKPAELNVQPAAQEEFSTTFGLTWREALQQGVVFNAMDATTALGISATELGAKWRTLQKGVNLLKFGGGFYCGKIDGIYVINAFYMDMRNKFTAPGTCIYIFETEWDPRTLSWEDFRGKVLGSTDPATAADGSLRKIVYEQWAALGLATEPNTGDNGVHASASPFEAMAERRNWLGVPIGDDFFGRAMLASGVAEAAVESWCNDPTVQFDGEGKSLFDLLEDLDARDCLRKCATIAAQNP